MISVQHASKTEYNQTNEKAELTLVIHWVLLLSHDQPLEAASLTGRCHDLADPL